MTFLTFDNVRSTESFIKKIPEGIMLAIYAQPRAAQTEYVGMHGDALKFRVAAPPVAGAANEAVCKFLARLFSLPKGAVSVQTGQTGRQKRILLKGVSTREVRQVFKLPDPATQP